MSVVNQMLLDIDRRRAEAGIDANPNAEIRGVGSHLPKTSAARPAPRPPVAATIIVVTAVVVLVLAAVTGVWWMTRTSSPTPTPVAVNAQRPPPAPAAPTPVANQTATAIAVAPPDVAKTDPNAAPQTINSAMAAAAGATPPVRPEPPSIATDAKPASPEKPAMKLSMKLSALLAETPPPVRANLPAASPATQPTTTRSVTSPTTTPTSVPPPLPGTTTITTVPTNAPVRQVAADETVRVARALWADGSRAAATATLREALATAESARSNVATAALARELARLEVADNRAQVALDLLRRLEPVLVDDVDAWALRGNAEQRLGLHTEAAESYLAALRARPTEGKWMIGAAISLAASGKTDEARVWVERARQRGAVTPTIASYLQQLGISSRP